MDQCDFLAPPGKDVEIALGSGSRTFRFYPVSVRMLFRLQQVAKPLAKAVAAIWLPIGRECERVEEQLAQGDDSIRKVREAPIDAGMAKIKLEQRAHAIEQLFDAFGQESNQRLLAMLIMDSLRDESWSRPAKTDEADAFLDSVSFPTLVRMVAAAWEASVEALGPFGGKASQALAGLKETVPV